MSIYTDYPHNTSQSSKSSHPRDESETGVMTKTRPKIKKPSMYQVLLLNDDFTPMDFVVDILKNFFQKNQEDAIDITMQVHRKGIGICGIYTYEIAETKVEQVMFHAQQNEHPLQCTLEKNS